MKPEWRRKESRRSRRFLLLTVLLAGCRSLSEIPPAPPPSYVFRDVAQEVGLEYVGSTFSVAAADFDRDGWPDLAMSGHDSLRIWRRQGDAGRFRDARDLGTFERGDIHGLSWVDLDDDGWLDLYVSHGARRGLGTGENRLYRNREGRSFEWATDLPDVLADPLGRGRCSIPQDVDGDGRLDLMIFNTYQEGRPQRLAVDSGGGFEDRAVATGLAHVRADCMTLTRPEADSPPLFLSYGGGPESSRAYRLDPHGRLDDVTEDLGLRTSRVGLYAIARGDYDNDGDVDLYFVHGHGPPQTLRQEEGALRFRLVAYDLERRYGFRFRAPQGFTIDLAVGSIRAASRVCLGALGHHPKAVPWHMETGNPSLEGRPELGKDAEAGVYMWREDEDEVVLTLVGDRQRIRGASGVVSGAGVELLETFQPNDRLRPQPNRLLAYENGRFVDRTQEAGVGDPSSGRDAAFFDMDNDGDLDLFLVNGGTAFDNPPDVLYRNNGDGTFTDVTREAGVAGPREGRGNTVLVFDYDADGRLDVFVANGEGPLISNIGPSVLWHNRTRGGKWARVELFAAPGNGFALGTRVTAFFGQHRLALERSATTGRFSTSVLPLHVGLGSEQEARLLVRWPSGRQQEFRVRAGTTTRLRESTAKR